MKIVLKNSSGVSQQEFIYEIRMFAPRKLCFLDECNKSEIDIYGGTRTRMNPLTGERRGEVVASNFREKRFNVFSCCTIAASNAVGPVLFNISEHNGDSLEYVNFVNMALDCGFFEQNSVLVIDNASIHGGLVGENLAERVWNYTDPRYNNNEPLHLLIMFLPTRFFELNPMEIVFGMMRNKATYADLLRLYDGYDVPRALVDALCSITVDQVRGCYKKCGYI